LCLRNNANNDLCYIATCRQSIQINLSLSETLSIHTKIKFLTMNNGYCQSVEQQNLAVHGLHTCPVVADTSVDCQMRSNRPLTELCHWQRCMVQMRGWSGCVFFIWEGISHHSGVLSSTEHPFSRSNDLIIVTDMQFFVECCSCVCVYLSVSANACVPVVCDVIQYLWATML